ncbi:MAG: hypothetical protein GY863_14300, partial [bacterium]|nr:hypothetical protein [bacterium]
MYIFDKKDANYRADYEAITKELNQFSEEKKFQDMLGLINGLAKNDLFFLLYFVLNVMPVNDP